MSDIYGKCLNPLCHSSCQRFMRKFVAPGEIAPGKCLNREEGKHNILWKITIAVSDDQLNAQVIGSNNITDAVFFKFMKNLSIMTISRSSYGRVHSTFRRFGVSDRRRTF